MAESSWSERLHQKCADPLLVHQKKVTGNLREVKDDDIKTLDLKVPLHHGQKICRNCQEKLKAMREKQDESSGESTSSGSDIVEPGVSASSNFHPVSEDLEELNQSLFVFEESPVEKKKMRTSEKYAKQKTEKVKKSVVRKIQEWTPHDVSTSEESMKETEDDGEEMINQLKQKFSQCTSRREQIQVLTVLPMSWTLPKIESEFGVTNYMAREAKKLQRKEGILSIPTLRTGKFPEETVSEVIAFYNEEEISRVMPGKKDFVSVKDNGNKVQKQKRLILCNLKEAYQKFKERFPNKKISFSKFADLRPKECILAGASGTHSVCVCTIHQNIKLMILGSKLDKFTKETEKPLKGYADCLAAITCGEPQASCHLGACEKCLDTERFKKQLLEIFSRNSVEDVEYKQWIATDRSSLENVSETVEEFAVNFCNKLKILKRHDFIAKKQSLYCSEVKESLGDGQFLVIGDFAENYSFILQDVAQGFHWNNAQATLHPFVSYYRENEELKHISFVVISDCLVHDTSAVHLYQKHLIEFLENFIGKKPAKLIYFSDGAASQYKNFKNFLNLCHHEKEFGIQAEWHFFATSHGKGPCDGVGGTVKRLAARTSLQRPYCQQIMTPRQLYEFASEKIPSIHFKFCSKAEWEVETKLLEERFSKGKTIQGTQKLHAFYPVSASTLHVKIYSASDQMKLERIASDAGPHEIPFEDIKGFVTAVYDDHWYLACVLQAFPDDLEVRVSFLQPHGPSASFSYPRRPDILNIPSSDILTLADPVSTSSTGRTYRLTQAENDAANNSLLQKLEK